MYICKLQNQDSKKKCRLNYKLAQNARTFPPISSTYIGSPPSRLIETAD